MMSLYQVMNSQQVIDGLIHLSSSDDEEDFDNLDGLYSRIDEEILHDRNIAIPDCNGEGGRGIRNRMPVGQEE